MKSLGWLYLLMLALLAVCQALLGASAPVLAALVIVAAGAFWPMRKRVLQISDVLYGIMSIYFGTASLIVKTMAGQPVQSNLAEPGMSAGYLVVGFASITAGYIVSQAFRRPARLAHALREITADPGNLARFAMPAFLLGALFLLLQTLFRGLAVNGGFEAGFGGFGTFYPLLVLGAAMQAALVARRPRQQRHKLLLAGMAIIVLALTLADNTKRTLFDFLLVVIAASLAMGVRPRLHWIVPAALGTLLIMIYVVPAIQIVRTQADVRGPARITATLSVIADHRFDPARLSTEADRIAAGYQHGYRDSYVYPLAWNVERFTMIQPIDQVARNLDERGTMGGADLLRDPAETLLPSILIKKTLATSPDRIAWHFGFRADGSIARPVVGLIASSLAAFGLIGVILLPALIVACTFTALDFVGGPLRGNPWAVFLLASTTFLAEREVSTTLSFFCRSFLFIMATGGVLWLLGQRPVRRDRVVPINGMTL